MKQFKLTFLLTVLMSMFGAKAFAYDIAVANADGVTIYYTYTNNKTELAVSNQGSSFTPYSGVVNIPESVTYKGTTYPVTSIRSLAFRDCGSLTSVTIPNSVTSIENSAFQGCSGLTKVIVNDIAAWCNISFGSFSTSNPLYYAKHLYSDENTEITNLVIPDGVTSIGSCAFASCTGLTSVTIPNSVTSIGSSTFSSCKGLTSVTIPNSVTSIGEYAFNSCGLTSVTIGNSVTSIGNYAFYNCSGLTSVTINSNAIASKKYTYSSSLKDIFGSQVKQYVLGDDITSIGSYAFSSCKGLTSVTIPNSVTSIGSSAFAYCSGLTSVTIPNSVTSIGNEAFYDCYKLTSVTIPNSVTSIGDRAFYDCDKLTSVTIPNSVTSIGNYAFYNCSGLTSVTINSNAIASKNYAAINSSFAKIFGSQVTEYILGNDVTAIGTNTFSDCSELTTLTISKNVTKIGKSAFTNCTKLTNLISRATTPPLCGPQALDGVDKWDCSLFVPTGSLSAYQAADQWKDFFFIEESDVTAINRIYDDEAEGRIVGIYDLNGRKLERLQRGMNIVRMSDGTTKKVVIK